MTKKWYGVLVAVGTVLLIGVVFGATYAYIVARTNEVTANTGTGKLDVVYNVDSGTTGELIPSTSREDGLKSVATAKINTGSVPAAFNIYITPTVIEGLAVAGLKWEVEGYVSGNSAPVYSNNGNFDGATANKAIKIVDGYNLTTSETTFNIYIWVDNSLMNSSMAGKKFTAKISADSVPVTGNVG